MSTKAIHLELAGELLLVALFRLVGASSAGGHPKQIRSDNSINYVGVEK